MTLRSPLVPCLTPASVWAHAQAFVFSLEKQIDERRASLQACTTQADKAKVEAALAKDLQQAVSHAGRSREHHMPPETVRTAWAAAHARCRKPYQPHRMSPSMS